MGGFRRVISKMFPNTVIPLEGQDHLHSLSQKLLYRRRLIERCYPGTYTINSYILRAVRKLERLVDKHMESVGAQRIAMPSLSLAEPWRETGRWDDMGSELFKLTDRSSNDLCLAPTHEETVCSMVANHRVSYKALPLLLYQITNKFRDEPHPKHGLLRSREFLMKDLYTFDEDHEKARTTYDAIVACYDSLFKELGLDAIQVSADTGAIGGSLSHEFHVEASIGEDTLKVCPQCGNAANSELLVNGSDDHCEAAGCDGKYNTVKGIELAHAFLLGERYSKPLNVVYRDRQNKPKYAYMGCYGVGITRLLAAAIEVFSTEDQLKMPRAIAPYSLMIIPQKKGYKCEESLTLSHDLYDLVDRQPTLQGEVILDDRVEHSIGFRVREARLHGYPMVACVTKQALPGAEGGQKVELMDLYEQTSCTVALDEFIPAVVSGVSVR